MEGGSSSCWWLSVALLGKEVRSMAFRRRRRGGFRRRRFGGSRRRRRLRVGYRM